MLDEAEIGERDVVLVGAGVVGQAILNAHLAVGINVTLADQDELAVAAAVAKSTFDRQLWQVEKQPSIGGKLHSVRFASVNSVAPLLSQTLVIESIVERLEVKQAFFRDAESWFGDDAILCSNTSTIRLEAIGQSLAHPQRLCGMHFFMPVDRRDAVEVIRASQASEHVIQLVQQHVRRLGKEPLVVADAPGFVVNRMLAPYLNQAMTLLCGGVSAERIETAALAYGMPMSPLELIDWIGTRTTFDAGRVYWQAFPARLDPSPLIAALVKKKRVGRGSGAGFYDYLDGQRSATLADEVVEFAERYHRELPDVNDDEIVELLAIPMWIEAKRIFAEQVVTKQSDIETAMSGGLGYQPRGQWNAFFDSLTQAKIANAIEKWSRVFRSMCDA